ncbi:MAG: hypothetical protein C0469_10590, partial [Cyanobacteria bacterium DS2.3.42]|nr:hypothetical protein [Cyanobacteria bacterium DS2.3.42]
MRDQRQDNPQKTEGEVKLKLRAAFDNKLWITFLLSLTLLSSCSSEEVIVDKAPELVNKHIYDKDNRPKSEIKRHPSVEANTHWEFSFVPEVQVKNNKLERRGNEFVASVKVERVKIDLALPIDMWLPESASEKVIAHEEGHIAICKHFYKDADYAAREHANALLGRVFSGHGQDESECVRNAMEAISTVLSEAYQKRVIQP